MYFIVSFCKKQKDVRYIERVRKIFGILSPGVYSKFLQRTIRLQTLNVVVARPTESKISYCLRVE